MIEITGLHTGAAHGTTSLLFLLELLSYTFMVLMVASCYSFRHLFQRGVKGCAACGAGGRKLGSWQYRLNQSHYIFFWLAVGFKLLQLGGAAYVSGIPTLGELFVFPTSLELLTTLVFFAWAGTCYYFRYVTETKAFRHPPACALPGGAGNQVGTGEKGFYRYHRYLLYLVLVHLPIYPVAIVTGSVVAGVVAAGAVVLIVILGSALFAVSPKTVRKSAT